jgi:HEAT repeat protein
VGLCLTVGCQSEPIPDSLARELEEMPPTSLAPEPEDRLRRERPDMSWLQPSEPIVRPVSEWTLRETAEDALGRMGEAAVPMLIEKLRFEHPDPRRQAEVRRQAAEVLARIGPQAAPAVPMLIEALEDPSLDVRKSAAFALGQIGPAASAAAPALLKAMLEAPNAPASP